MNNITRYCIFAGCLFFGAGLFAQDAVKTLQGTSAEIEANKAGMSLPDAINKAKSAGYSDQDIINAAGQTGLKSKTSVEQPVTGEDVDSEIIESPIEQKRSIPAGCKAFSYIDVINTPKKVIFSVPPFGYEFFSQNLKTFEPLDYGPTDPNYQIGPGDEISVSLFGDVQYSGSYKVDREGKITIPEAGIVLMNGLTLEQADRKLKDRLATVYSGIRSRSISVDVTLGKLKIIKIFVMGEVKQPGGYTISSTSTAFTAMYYAAGPTNQGSLRNIQVLRNNKLVSTVDLYDLLLKGKKDSDIRLQNGDVVFVPLALKKVAVCGEVNRPGIYEPLSGEGLKAILSLAGGFRPDTYTNVIQINRTGANGLNTLMDISYQQIATSAAEYQLENEDVIGIYKLPESVDNFASIDGPVLVPGNFEITENTSVRELIAKAGGLLKIAYPLKGEVSRMLYYSKPESTVTFHLNLENETDLDFKLKFRDKVIVRYDPDYKPQRMVFVGGMVYFPGYYSLARDDERLSSILTRSGGLKPQAYPEGGIFTRADDGQIDVKIRYALNLKESRDDLVMRNGDSLFIPERPATVKVSGEVFFPVNTIYEPNRGFKYYLEKVGGTTELADRKRITVRLPNGRNMKPKTFMGLFQRNIPPGAAIIVPKKKEIKEIKWGEVLQNTTAILSATAVTILAVQQMR